MQTEWDCKWQWEWAMACRGEENFRQTGKEKSSSILLPGCTYLSTWHTLYYTYCRNICEGKMLVTCKRKTLQRTFSPNTDNEWTIKTTSTLTELCRQLDVASDCNGWNMQLEWRMIKWWTNIQGWLDDTEDLEVLTVQRWYRRMKTWTDWYPIHWSRIVQQATVSKQAWWCHGRV